MKIQTNILVSFLEKIKLNGSIMELILDFQESGMKINSVDLSQTCMVNAEMNKDAFTDYNAIGKVGIQDLTEIIMILKTFGEDIEINVDGNLLTINQPGLKMETELVNIEFIKEPPAMPNLIFNENINVNASEINKFITDVSINKNFNINISTVEKKFILNNSGKFKFTKELNVDEAQGGFSGAYSKPLIDSIKGLNNDITLSMNKDEKNGYPLKIVEKTKESIISIIVAPITTSE